MSMENRHIILIKVLIKIYRTNNCFKGYLRKSYLDMNTETV